MASKLRRDEAVVDLLVAHKRLCVSIGIAPLDCDTTLAGAAGGNYQMASVDFPKAAQQPVLQAVSVPEHRARIQAC
ncbi:MAG: hypothetical protein HC887_04110 [Desulfobacteraceae bacterium]|nr:hypothetical protein [Desulfobacteraceae bacterium]